ncbi:MAG: DUF423 domain-containing protein [Saprospiraceae bacterium]|nr:DUF423 domain-containing protein [Saprospiraceae bacterium]
MKEKQLLIVTGILGALAVILGAFGAHSLKEVLPPDKLVTYNTGITYHFNHVLALFMTIFFKKNHSKWFSMASIAFIVGILFFSGSLYLLATRELIGLSTYKWLGPITPIGGVFFILGWISIAIAGLKYPNEEAAK